MSDREIVLSPAETLVSRPAIYLESDLDLITAVMEDTTMDTERLRIRGGAKEHRATMVHELWNAQILNGYVYKRAIVYPVSPAEGRPLVIRERTEKIPEAALACSLYGGVYFGHWMADDVARFLVLKDYASPVIVKRKRFTHEPGYSAIFGVNPGEITNIQCKRLLLLGDTGQNSFRKSRYAQLRERLKTVGAAHKNHRVWIRRGKGGAKRDLVNIDEVEAWLVSQGFVMVTPEEMTAEEIARQMVGARVAFGIEGSHLAHALYSVADGGAICALQPPFRFNNVYKDRADCLDLRYAFVVGETAEGGFRLEIDHLKRFLDKVDRETGYSG
ncbi:glycosyltransferase family 61 protein [Paracidobacterium acidisoli]|nr:glycosyltransferase family 61 protein [Paracidobacterium acidisoli]MBT9330233.1 glycosyltransferase family 61 protein [Paracidobacterium acidisoli]